eukprot:1364262-Pyramimonas_sp.AAC.1
MAMALNVHGTHENGIETDVPVGGYPFHVDVTPQPPMVNMIIEISIHMCIRSTTRRRNITMTIFANK